MATQILSTTIGRTRFAALAAALGCALWLQPGTVFAQQAPAPKPPASKPAPAAPAAPAAAAPAAGASAAKADPQALPEGVPNPWVKICSQDAAGKDVCLVAQEQRTREFTYSVALKETAGDPKKVLLVAIPPMMAIQVGVGVVVDKGKAETGKFTICFPNACYAEVPVSDVLFKALQTGADLRVVAIPAQQQTANQKQATFPLKLAGFKLAYDGAGFNPVAEKAKQDQLQDEMNKRAEEMRKKLGEKPTN